MFVYTLIVTVLMAAALPALAQEAATKTNTNWPGYREGDYILRNYKFVSGESLPEVKLHYRTIGTSKKNAAGEVVAINWGGGPDEKGMIGCGNPVQRFAPQLEAAVKESARRP